MSHNSCGLSHAQPTLSPIVGTSLAIQKLHQQIHKTSGGSYPVLLQGETGTGKELVARAIHSSGPSHLGPFVPVDCPAISPSLFETELFGHAKGAFTGAMDARKGLMESSDGGTLFLDEVGDLPIGLQAKLLRTLQQREIRRVGSNNTIAVKTRIISATNVNLEKAVRQGTFRQDLFFRLNVVQVSIPPLRDRRPDVRILAEHFLETFREPGEGNWTISNEAMAVLLTYDWPGNVRELENAIQCGMALASRSTIQVDDLPPGISEHTCKPEEVFSLNLQAQENRAIQIALNKTGGHALAAAHMLGIGKTTLYRKLKQIKFLL